MKPPRTSAVPTIHPTINAVEPGEDIVDVWIVRQQPPRRVIREKPRWTVLENLVRERSAQIYELWHDTPFESADCKPDHSEHDQRRIPRLHLR